MSGRVRVLWVLGLASPLALLLATASWLRRHSFETDASLDRPGRLRRLLEACVEGRAALVAELLDADASLLDAEDGNGWTCLINARAVTRSWDPYLIHGPNGKMSKTSPLPYIK